MKIQYFVVLALIISDFIYAAPPQVTRSKLFQSCVEQVQSDESEVRDIICGHIDQKQSKGAQIFIKTAEGESLPVGEVYLPCAKKVFIKGLILTPPQISRNEIINQERDQQEISSEDGGYRVINDLGCKTPYPLYFD